MAAMDIDVGLRLMQLYQALRSSADPREKDAIKAKIDALVAEAHAHFDSQPMIVGTAHPSRKLDA